MSNIEKNIFTIIIVFIFSTLLAYGEDSYPCGEEINCPTGYNYPYLICAYDEEDELKGAVRVICGDDPYNLDFPMDYKLRKVNLPICIDPQKSTIPNEVDMLVGVKVFDINKAMDDINNALYNWNCLCGKQDDPCGCTIKLYFTKNIKNFENKSAIAESGVLYSRYYCNVTCAKSFIVFNNSDDFTQREAGTPRKYFINENLITSEKLNNLRTHNKIVYNFIDVVMHELGHTLGFDHYDESDYPPFVGCNPPVSGIMDHERDPATGKSDGLNIHDKCMFIKLYCPDLVPIEERIVKKETEVYNYPNPIENVTRLTFTVPQKGANVKIIVYDQLGRKVIVPVERFYSGGDYDKQIDLSGLSSGLYYYTVQIGNKAKTGKIVVGK